MFVFFKQKTAYEVRISDWSSDVCSSDLEHLADVEHAQAAQFQQVLQQFRAGAVEYVGCDLGEFRRVVGDQAVAAREQFGCQLALARPRFAGDQQDRKSVV